MSKTGIEAMSYCIHSFMSEKMGLGGGELLVFAIIYSFTKGEKGIFYGTQNYLSRVSGTSQSTVKRALARLLEKGYIEKCCVGERDGYRAIYIEGAEDCEDTEAPPNDEENKLPRPSVMRSLDIDIRSKIKPEKRPKYEFHPVGRRGYVTMTAEQYKRLLKLVTSDVLTAYISRLEKLIEDNGYKTFSPYKTIKRWIYEDASV